VSTTCAFCGATGKLTGEHVLGDWMSKIGVRLDPVAHFMGRLNRMGRDIGVTRPFARTVRDVCGPCNNGWMSRLEVVAQRVLTPLILGGTAHIPQSDHAPIVAWLQKTALVAMLMSSEDERADGYGLPTHEYRALYDQRAAMDPLPATQAWIGRYAGESRLASTWVTPLVVGVDGLPEIDSPQGYLTTIVVGELLLQGVRFTTPSLQLDIKTSSALTQLWPTVDDITWPSSPPMDDAAYLRLAGGRNLRSTEPPLTVGPWKRATDLRTSQAVGSMVELPTICGKHVVCYPAVLVREAKRGTFYAFITSCECGTAYQITTEADGAHCKAAGDPAVIQEQYEALAGKEYIIDDANGRFCCKRLSSP
jgi:hypothetical protein